MIIPKPQKIAYPTLLEMPCPVLFGYTLETAFAEKLESIVKLASVNTRMKDFYDIWTMTRNHRMSQISVNDAIQRVFSNRGTPLKYPVAFTPAFYDLPETKQRWKQFLSMIGRETVPFEEVIIDLSAFIKEIIDFS